MGQIIYLMPAERRELLIELLKTKVGEGFTSKAPWLDEEARQFYNDSLSFTLQNFIEVAPTEDRYGDVDPDH
jgi:hypothetical protein